MRTWLLLLLAVVACRKADAPAPTVAARSAAAADALWTMAPPNMVSGVVVTPRAVGLAEDAGLALQALVTRPELAAIAGDLRANLEGGLGGPFRGLAGLGLDRGRGFAWFVTGDDATVMVVPVKDLAALKKVVRDESGPDQLLGLSCKAVAGAYACASDPELLDRLGAASVPTALAALGARGDVEAVFPGAEPTVGVVQLERGALVLRAAATVPPPVVAALGGQHRPRVEADSTSFAVLGLAPLLQLMPDVPLADEVTLHGLARSLAGPLTFSLGAGGVRPDLRLPLADPAPMRAVLARCPELASPTWKASARPDGGCRVSVPELGGLLLELRLEGNELHVTTPGAADRGLAVPMSPLGRELADGTWGAAFWGHGFSSSFPGAAQLPVEGATLAGVARLLSLFNELGLAARLDGDRVHVVLGVRTAWANPPDVVARLLAVSTDDLMAGTRAPLDAVVRSAPSAPFADDLRAGHVGLMAPVMALGVVSAVAIPAFMDYMKKGKRSEAELNLEAIGKSARSSYAMDGALPVIRAPLTPSRSCCEYPMKKCEITQADWYVPAWDWLDFELVEPHYFRYGYQSDGKTLTAVAIGDLDCDGNEVTYTLTLTTDGGTPRITLDRPKTTD